METDRKLQIKNTERYEYKGVCHSSTAGVQQEIYSYHPKSFCKL